MQDKRIRRTKKSKQEDEEIRTGGRTNQNRRTNKSEQEGVRALIVSVACAAAAPWVIALHAMQKKGWFGNKSSGRRNQNRRTKKSEQEDEEVRTGGRRNQNKRVFLH